MQIAELHLNYAIAVSFHILSILSTNLPAISSVQAETATENKPQEYGNTQAIVCPYKINQLASFPLYDIHKLTSSCELRSQFVIVRAPSPLKPIFVAGACTRLLLVTDSCWMRRTSALISGLHRSVSISVSLTALLPCSEILFSLDVNHFAFINS